MNPSGVKNQKDDEEESSDGEIKSQAVVKYTSCRPPSNFSQLRCNTNLNLLPPPNFVRNSINFNGMQQAAIHRSGFSSFRMTHMFPDCIGGVDVVSDAEIIKRLLRLPYAPNSALSLMVHRIGNTMLIDEFDLQKYLLCRSPVEWEWLKNFMRDRIINRMSNEEIRYLITNRSRHVLQERLLHQKFLQHSLLDEEEDQAEPPPRQQQLRESPSLQLQGQGPILPEPGVEQSVPDPRFTHTFNRSIVWNFEDIRMLIGTDMPIFGGGTRPCISLRLRDMKKPINVLTGIDYWLDNLMCNVPEVVMCYHLDGIVQKYELIKTEDLPFLENSQFSPKIIRNVAQNILAFLKANATKAGHTYWLFKRPKDDVVKLYDLTTLCTEGEHKTPKPPAEPTSEKNAAEADGGSGDVSNPFTIPVAMLLYSVARNMKSSVEKMTNQQAGAVKMLLDNCIKLLPKETHPQIVVSSHYMLSDLNIPSGIDPQNISFSSGSDESEYDDESLYDEDDSDVEDFQAASSPHTSDELVDSGEVIAVKTIQEATAVQSKKKNWKHNTRPPALSSDTESRCFAALENIVAGLKCLKYFRESEQQTNEAERKKKIRKEAENLNMAKPLQPIPLPYETLTPQPMLVNPTDVIPLGWKGKEPPSDAQGSAGRKKNRGQKDQQKTEEKGQENLPVAGKFKAVKCWSLHLRLLLLEKATLTYRVLGELAYGQGDLAKAFRYLNLSFRCQDAVRKYWPSNGKEVSSLLSRAGDCYLEFGKNFKNIDETQKTTNALTENDRIIVEFIESDDEDAQRFGLPRAGGTAEGLLKISLFVYERALKMDMGMLRGHLIRRIGNVVNEIGTFYMSEALTMFNRRKQGELREEENVQKYQEKYLNYMAEAHKHLTRSIELFQEVDDNVNLALIYCNMGRYSRQMADLMTFPLHDPRRVESMTRKYYNEAFGAYNTALSKLEERKRNPEIWDIAHWELAMATFLLAQRMQDFWDVKCERYQEIMELLQRSLKLCQSHSDVERMTSYTYRMGQIYTRLGIVCGCVVKYQSGSCDEKKKKNMVQLCRFYFEKAFALFRGSSNHGECFEVLTELMEFTDNQMDTVGRTKTLQQAISILRQAKDFLDTLAGLDETAEVNLGMFESQFQTVFKNLLRATMAAKAAGGGGGVKDASTELLNVLKSIYSASLGKSNKDEAAKEKIQQNISTILEIYSNFNNRNV
ncbi:erythroid differentiation-related factor 1 [Lutzomyia longipalpis]|uniref:erythroid differentiation-related factor 1 n=1 Tax=Lutzomyia longipalpis TaxID=7200 RepID=UPI0024835D29|nr:erythroid differentiation-related factor 1 [Lutzomyia longipalpis]